MSTDPDSIASNPVPVKCDRIWRFTKTKFVGLRQITMKNSTNVLNLEQLSQHNRREMYSSQMALNFMQFMKIFRAWSSLIKVLFHSVLEFNKKDES